MTNSNENELKVGDIELSEYEFQMLKLKQGLYISYPRIIALLGSQQAELEAARKEIERLNQYVEKIQNDYCDLSKINHSNMLKLDIPKGWQLVPTDPTADMLHEMRDTTLDYELDDLEERRMSKSPFNAVYKAMLKSAPKPED